MKKAIIIFLLSLFIQNLYCQNTVADYKKVADIYIKQKLPALFPKMKCRSVMYGNDENRSDFEYLLYKNTSTKTFAFNYIELFYDFPIEEIKDTMSFKVVLSKEKKVLDEKTTFNKIPECVIQNKVCGFISKDSAFAIARSNNILHPEILSGEFTKIGNVYFWIVQGIDSDSKTEDGIGIIDSRQIKKVDAIYGYISPYF